MGVTLAIKAILDLGAQSKVTGIYGKRMATRIYSLKSNSDELVCATGVCTVNGVHSSQLTNENASYTLSESHFGLVRNTATRQADLIQ